VLMGGETTGTYCHWSGDEVTQCVRSWWWVLKSVKVYVCVQAGRGTEVHGGEVEQQRQPEGNRDAGSSRNWCSCCAHTLMSGHRKRFLRD
jgi:hypothetical protein